MNDWFQAEKHAERAHQFFQAGQWHKALRELEAALAVNPHQSDWHFGRGLALDALERFEEAITSFEQALALRGEDLQTLLHLGIDLIRARRYRRALQVLGRANEIDPDFEPGYCYRIAAHAHLGQHEQAEVMFYLARQHSDHCPHCYDHLGQSLALRRRYDRAIWCWRQVLRLDPDHPDVRLHLAMAYHQLEQFERARHLFVQQLRFDPGDTRAMISLGQVLTEMDRPVEASELFRRALELSDRCAEAHLWLGLLSLQANHVDAAEFQLRKARHLDPQLPGLYLRMAQVALHRGNPGRARALLDDELDLHGHTTAQTLQIARTWIDLNDPHAAAALAGALLHESAQPLTPTQRANALLCRGVARLLVGQHTQGIADCRQVLRYQPRHAVAMHNLALAHIESGQLLRARYWLKRATETDGHDPRLRQIRQRLRLAQWRAGIRRTSRRLMNSLRRTRKLTDPRDQARMTKPE